jgi:hypothetical protein
VEGVEAVEGVDGSMVGRNPQTYQPRRWSRSTWISGSFLTGAPLRCASGSSSALSARCPANPSPISKGISSLYPQIYYCTAITTYRC